MNGKDLFIALGHIDEKYVHEAEIKKPSKKKSFIKFAMPMVASFTMIVFALSIYQNGGNTPPIDPNPDSIPPAIDEDIDGSTAPKNYKLHLNNINLISARDVAIKGHFWYEISKDQADKSLPIVSQKYDITGIAHYSSENEIATLFSVDSSIIIDESKSAKITIAPNKVEKCYIIDGDPILSEIEGIKIETGVFVTDKNSKGEQNYLYYADFELDNTAYYVELVSKNEEAVDPFTQLVADVILGGKADLSIFDNPVIPDLIDEQLSLQEAFNETDFGKYLLDIPSDYAFNSAYRWLNQNTNSLFISWSKDYNDVSITVYPNDEDSTSRIVSPEQTELYDMSLYPIPWADSMPKNTRQTIQNPVFRIEDLTLDMIRLRGYTRGEVGDPSGDSLNMRFSVLYDDIVVEIKSEGLSAKYLFDKLSSFTID